MNNDIIKLTKIVENKRNELRKRIVSYGKNKEKIITLEKYEELLFKLYEKLEKTI